MSAGEDGPYEPGWSPGVPSSGSGTRVAISARAVLFDLDGVLVDSAAVVERTWHRWMTRHDLRVPDLVRRAHGRRSIETVREVAPLLDSTAEVQWLAETELSDTEGLVAMRGAGGLFASIPDERCAVVTSGGRALAELRLRATGFHRPAELVTAEDIPHGKPAPDGYLLAARRLGVDPKDCVVLEDTPPGIAAGRAAGATVIAVATTFPANELHEANAVVSSLTAVTARSLSSRLHLEIDRIRTKAVALCRAGDRLLVERGHDRVLNEHFYRPIGGEVRFGENPRDAVAREWREEFGLELDAPTLLGILENRFVYEDRAGHEILVVFGARVRGAPSPDLGELESVDTDGMRHVAAWVPLTELREGAVPFRPAVALDLVDSPPHGRVADGASSLPE